MSASGTATLKGFCDVLAAFDMISGEGKVKASGDPRVRRCEIQLYTVIATRILAREDLVSAAVAMRGPI